MKCKNCGCEIKDTQTLITKVDLAFDVGSGPNGSGMARLSVAEWDEKIAFCCVGCLMEYLKVEASKTMFEYLKEKRL